MPLFRLLVFLFLILSQFISLAQESGAGFKIGGVASIVNITHEAKTYEKSILPCPVFSAFVYKDLGKRFGIYSEGGFTFMAVNHKDTATLLDYETNSYVFEDRTENLEIGMGSAMIAPVFKFTKNLFIMAGPQVDAILFAKYKGESRRSFIIKEHLPGTEFIVNSAQSKPLKVGFTAGIGFAKKIIRADIRYNMSFGNLFDKSIQEYDPKFARYKNATYSSLVITVGVIIPGMHFGTSKNMYRFE